MGTEAQSMMMQARDLCSCCYLIWNQSIAFNFANTKANSSLTAISTASSLYLIFRFLTSNIYIVATLI